MVVLLCLPAGLYAMSRKPPVFNSHPLVSHASGDVLVRSQGESAWEPVERGTLLLSGDVLRTGSKGRARIRFTSGSMELYEETEIRIPTIGKQERRKDIREVVVTAGRALLDIAVKEEGGSFLYRTGNAWGQTRKSLFTVSYLRDGTTVNIYTGEAHASSHDGYGLRISSLVTGSSLRIEGEGESGRIIRFDPREAIEAYGKNISPMLDEVSGLPVVGRDMSRTKGQELLMTSYRNLDSPGSAQRTGDSNDKGPGHPRPD